MRKIFPACALIVLALFGGCRLSRAPESLAPPPPPPAAPVSPPVGPPPEEAPPQQEPALGDYLDSLAGSIAQAQEEAKQEAFERLLRPQGSLALASIALSLVESDLAETTLLEKLSGLSQLLSEGKNDQASRALDELIIKIAPQEGKPPVSDSVSVDSLQGVLKSILAKQNQEALHRLDEIMEGVAASQALKETREIRADLEQALSAAALKRTMVVEVVLADASQRASHLKELLGQRKSAEPPAGQ